jgi:hypothetical protein
MPPSAKISDSPSAIQQIVGAGEKTVEHLFEVEDELHAEVPCAVVNLAGRGGSWMHVPHH